MGQMQGFRTKVTWEKGKRCMYASKIISEDDEPEIGDGRIKCPRRPTGYREGVGIFQDTRFVKRSSLKHKNISIGRGKNSSERVA